MTAAAGKLFAGIEAGGRGGTSTWRTRAGCRIRAGRARAALLERHLLDRARLGPGDDGAGAADRRVPAPRRPRGRPAIPRRSPARPWYPTRFRRPAARRRQGQLEGPPEAGRRPGQGRPDQGKQKLAEQNAKRTEQWANDPNTLWFGESKNAATSAAGVSKARYRITKDRVWIESGLLGTRTESVPLWAIKDMDVRQAVWQRGKDIGDVILNLEDPTLGADQDMFNMTGNIEGTTSGQDGPRQHREPLPGARHPGAADQRGADQEDHRAAVAVRAPDDAAGDGLRHAGAAARADPATPPQAPQLDLVEQLRKLGELRDAGILTDEEFAAQKAKLLG